MIRARLARALRVYLPIGLAATDFVVGPPTKDPLPPQERDAPWWIEVLVWVVVVLAGLAALRRLLS